ncbi:hypothetical protein JAAARDRAFT_53566 [Jaapia argillacea MUCL 33604]|uniref:RING-type domain-containing protein n=1 Tax=Jaapia argillacea MUCL 33604 TaxID=933084 RepID=A0A067QL45_9AGAM|nr:hypothetical protein JAAARDRAFT_53566 [Jaapia argillacea MUCL 33604]
MASTSYPRPSLSSLESFSYIYGRGDTDTRRCRLEGCVRPGKEDLGGFCSKRHAGDAVMRGEVEPCTQCDARPQSKGSLCVNCCDLALSIPQQGSRAVPRQSGVVYARVLSKNSCMVPGCKEAGREECSGFCSVGHGRESVRVGRVKGCTECSRDPQVEDGLCLLCIDRKTRAALRHPVASTSRSSGVTSGSSSDGSLTFNITAEATELAKYRSLLGELEESLTCLVCSELYTNPCSLSPCGHTACQKCLFNWFSASLGANKTCPECRSVVKEKPAEAWGVKSMVASLVRSGLCVGGKEVVDDVVRRDPWNGMFGRT